MNFEGGVSSHRRKTPSKKKRVLVKHPNYQLLGRNIGVDYLTLSFPVDPRGKVKKFTEFWERDEKKESDTRSWTKKRGPVVLSNGAEVWMSHKLIKGPNVSYLTVDFNPARVLEPDAPEGTAFANCHDWEEVVNLIAERVVLDAGVTPDAFADSTVYRIDLARDCRVDVPIGPLLVGLFFVPRKISNRPPSLALYKGLKATSAETFSMMYKRAGGVRVYDRRSAYEAVAPGTVRVETQIRSGKTLGRLGLKSLGCLNVETMVEGFLDRVDWASVEAPLLHGKALFDRAKSLSGSNFLSLAFCKYVEAVAEGWSDSIELEPDEMRFVQRMLQECASVDEAYAPRLDVKTGVFHQ